jgi:uncharacterized protein YciI
MLKGASMRSAGRSLTFLLSLIPVLPPTPLLAAEGPKSANPEPSKMAVVYMVFLRKAPGWTAGETPEHQALQEAHLANIRALWEARKLVIAGPMGDDGDLRGIFVFDVATLDEAKALVASDPAVKAGRLVAEIHPWWVERRALPEAGRYCQP